MSSVTQEVLSLYRTQPRVAILMSGVGSNAEALLGHEGVRELYDVGVIATDKVTSRAQEIAEANSLDLVSLPHEKFRDASERRAYFSELANALGNAGVQAAFYAGFMKIASNDFCEQFPGVNVHPANLAIVGEDGVAKYRGMHALSEMRQDLGYVQSTVHVVDTPVDAGTALTLSPKIYPHDNNETDAALHDRLKPLEHHTLPTTLATLGLGQLELRQLPLELGDR